MSEHAHNSPRPDMPAGAASHKPVCLPEADRLTEEQQSRVAAGKAVAIRGRALAKADLIVQQTSSSELLWYWTAKREQPLLIDDLYLPNSQEASLGHVRVDAEAVAAANREVRRRGGFITASGHSHHRWAAYSSEVDIQMFLQLAAESCGLSIHSRKSSMSQSLSTQTLQNHLGCQARDASTETAGAALVATFEDQPGLVVEVQGAAPGQHEALAVRLHWRQLRLLSIFSTHNLRGDLHFPILETCICQCCRTRIDQRFLMPEEILILGPVELGETDRAELLTELEKKAPRKPAWSGTKSSWRAATVDTVVGQPAGSQTDRPAATAHTGPEPFEIFRKGDASPVATVSAALLEKAAWQVPELAEALGWAEKDPRTN